MSILAAESMGQHELGIKLVWTGMAVVLFAYCRVKRIQPNTGLVQSPLEGIHLLALGGGMIIFWIAALQLLTNLTKQIPGWIADGQLTARGMTYIGFYATLIGIMAHGGILLAGKPRTRKIVGLNPSPIRYTIIYGLSGVLIALPVVWLAINVSETTMEWLHYPHPTEHALLKAMDADTDPLLRIAGTITAIILAPVFEEILFRGYLQNAVKIISGRTWIAVVLTSLVFAMIHESWTWLPIFALSILLGLFYEYSRSIWTSILLHALFNGYNVILWSAAN